MIFADKKKPVPTLGFRLMGTGSFYAADGTGSLAIYQPFWAITPTS